MYTNNNLNQLKIDSNLYNKYNFMCFYCFQLQRMRKVGFPAEAHAIQTEDGYLLTLYRIPNKNGPSVLLQHGLLSSFADFLISGKTKGLGMILINLQKLFLSLRDHLLRFNLENRKN